MPVLAENSSSSSSTIAEHIKLRRPRNQITQINQQQQQQQTIVEPDPNPQIPSIIQSTRCKTSISSLFLSTFSNTTTTTTTTNDNPIPTNNTNTKKKVNNFTQNTFRGLGCTAAASQQVSVPAVIRTSADWEGKKVRKKKQHAKKKSSYNKIGNENNKGSSGSGSGVVDNGCNMNPGDVWCGPGIGFSSDAVGSVDCVVSRRNVSERGKIDGDKISKREREREREVFFLALLQFLTFLCASLYFSYDLYTTMALGIDIVAGY